MPTEAKYECEVVNYHNKKLSVRKEHSVTYPTLFTMDPGTKFSGYELYVEESERKVWMRTINGWVAVLWPNQAQILEGEGTIRRVSYTEIDSSGTTGKKVVSLVLVGIDGVTQEFIPKDHYFSLHPFIEAHPEAVFIKTVNVADKTDAEAKRSVGAEFAQEVFIYGTTTGIPLSHMLAIKANVTYTEGMGKTPAGMGIITDRYFTEGFIGGMQELGFQSSNMYLREGNWMKNGYCPTDLVHTGYLEMAEATGINLLYFPTGRRIDELTLEELQQWTEVVWKEVPDGVVFRRVGYMSPYNREDAWLINISKFKAHYMGMTLCAKNLQGMCVTPHVRFCEDEGATSQHPEFVLEDFQANFSDRISSLHAGHVQAGIPRWDRTGSDSSSGYGMERWAQRTCDSLSVTNVGLNVIEGIYGRNGNGFMLGPDLDGKAEDFMTKILIFGKDPIRVDIIGTWLAGHEPGNFGFFHIARERGLSTVLSPWEIPVYHWDKQNPQQALLDDFERTPLVTPYLRKDYNGQVEALYHLVDEPFDYQSL